MTEQEWLDCNDPELMLHFARGRASEAQLRLFACGCCRRIWPLLKDERSQNAVAIAELYAYRHAPIGSLRAAYQAAIVVPSRFPYWECHSGTCYASWPDFASEPWPPTRVAATVARTVAAHFTAQLEPEHLTRQWAYFEARERQQQAILLRRFVDYPLAVPIGSRAWPSVVVELAQALRDGSPCHFALSDALLEHDRPELAQHFRLPVHPQNCWGFERILGEP